MQRTAYELGLSRGGSEMCITDSCRNRSVIVDGRTSGLPDGGAHGRSVEEVCAAVIDIASSFLVMELDRQPLPSDFVHSGGTAAVLGLPLIHI